MTDLTTMHLKCLLEKATPGPWESSAVVDAICEDWDSYLLHLYMGNTCLSQVSSVQYEDESYESLDLAALAPELAQEVIRLREELIDWANDEARAHNALVKRAQEAGGAGIVSTHKTIYNRIWEILGDTND